MPASDHRSDPAVRSSTSGSDADQAIDELEESRRRFSMALEAARAGAWEWDIETNRTTWSPENYAVLGLPRGTGEATYAEWLARVHPEDRAEAERAVQRAVESRGDLDIQFRVVWPDGNVRWIRDVGRMMLDGTGTPIGMYGIQIDVTERHALEENLRHSQRMEAMGRLAGAVAHDFNNILTLITGYGDLLQRDSRLHEDLRTNVDEIVRAASRAAELTRQLLAFGRRQLLRPRVLDLNKAIIGMEGLIRRALGEDIEYRTELMDRAALVRADPLQIEQVVLNLVVNARAAMAAGGTLIVRTSVTDSNPVGIPCVTLRVADTGHGMDEETRARIFDPFFTTKSLERGTGLGLASVHAIVAQCRGHVDVESTLGQGSTFSICLPVVDQPETPVEQTAHKSWRDLEGHETVLVIDNEPEIRDLIHEVLTGLGYSVLSAGSAEEARTIQERHEHIDVLLTDVVLPGQSGPRFAREFERTCPGAAIVFMSGYSPEAIVQHGAWGDAVEILDKPFPPERLAQRLRSVLDQRVASRTQSDQGP